MGVTLNSGMHDWKGPLVATNQHDEQKIAERIRRIKANLQRLFVVAILQRRMTTKRAGRSRNVVHCSWHIAKKWN